MITFESFEKERSLKDLTTFGIGGAADYFVEVHQIPTMQKLLPFCQKERLPFLILGKGSNILFDDRGFKGVIIANRIDFIDRKDPLSWHVGGGYSFSLLGTQTARQGLGGLEFASGIPGSVGGAVYMNAGANGCETASSLLSVDFVTAEGELLCLPKEELEFRYRFSSFQRRLGAIVGATFRLTPSLEARDKQLQIIQYRKKTQPYNAQSAGCMFRNPSCHYAGALIEQSGLKGVSIGGAQVSPLHANFVVNTGTASSKEVLQLIHHIQEIVKTKSGIELESEVRLIPYEIRQDENRSE